MSISRRTLLALTPLPLLAACTPIPAASTSAQTSASAQPLDFVGLEPDIQTLELNPLTDEILTQMGHTATSVSELIAACGDHLHYAAKDLEKDAVPQLLTLPMGGYANSILVTEATLPEIAFFDVAGVGESTAYTVPAAVRVAGGVEKVENISRSFVSADGTVTITAQQLVFYLDPQMTRTLGVEA